MRKGLALSVALHTASPRKVKFIQANIGVDLWRQGASQKTYKMLSMLGICQSANAARRHVDYFADQCDREVDNWKGTLEVSVNIGNSYDIQQLNVMYIVIEK